MLQVVFSGLEKRNFFLYLCGRSWCLCLFSGGWSWGGVRDPTVLFPLLRWTLVSHYFKVWQNFKCKKTTSVYIEFTFHLWHVWTSLFSQSISCCPVKPKILYYASKTSTMNSPNSCKVQMAGLITDKQSEQKKKRRDENESGREALHHVGQDSLREREV